MWYWYIEQENEILVDIDCKTEHNKRLAKIRSRILGAHDKGVIDIDSYVFYASVKEYHYHLMVKLKSAMHPHRRLLWASRFGDDMFRNQMNLARLLEYGHSWSLLLAPCIRRSYHRRPDYQCNCQGKHKFEVMSKCPVAQRLNGVSFGEDHFGDPIHAGDEVILGKPVSSAEASRIVTNYKGGA